MCGRFALYTSGERIAEEFDLAEIPDIRPHYNVAPTQTVPVVRAATGGRELTLLKWGLVPSWAETGRFRFSLDTRHNRSCRAGSA
jgi:putative SOS response-associated peptidase YedK